jgi:hypothetical protein
VPPLLDVTSGGGLLLQNYTTGSANSASTTSKHSEEAKAFVMERTRDILGKITNSATK